MLRKSCFIIIGTLIISGIIFFDYLKVFAFPLTRVLRSPYTVDQRLAQYREPVRERLQADFDRAGVPYPPVKIALIGIKQDRSLQLYAAGKDQKFLLIKTYPVLAASGTLGPKLKSGDYQVPEGLYRINFLNPNSKFHLSLRVDYPNQYDRQHAAKEGRTNLGGDIMIHGNRLSIGCLAMGDSAVEELFITAALIGIDNVSVILTPLDFRRNYQEADLPTTKAWYRDLYQQLAEELEKFPIAQ